MYHFMSALLALFIKYSANIIAKPDHEPTGGRDGTDSVVGDWNGNRGGASRTERGKMSGSPGTSAREFLTGTGRLESHTSWARFQRLVRPI